MKSWFSVIVWGGPHGKFAEDALTPGFAFNRVRIEYKKQIKPGEKVTPFRFDAENGLSVVDLRDADGNSCAVAEFSTSPASYDY